MKEVLVLRQVPHETLGTIELALRAAGLPHRYVDLFDDPPGSLDLSDALGMVELGGPMNVDQTDDYPFLADRRRAGSPFAAAGRLPRRAVVGQDPRCAGVSQRFEGNRLVRDRFVAGGRRRHLAARFRRSVAGLPVARRHIRSAFWRGAVGPRRAVRPSGIPFRSFGLGASVSRRDDRSDSLRVARRARQPRGVGGRGRCRSGCDSPSGAASRGRRATLR